jgi:hypothetical protein
MPVAPGVFTDKGNPMNTATTLGMVALLATTGAAIAGEPMVLNDAQLDHITGGPIEIRELHIRTETGPVKVEISFEGQHPAQPPANVRFTADPGFILIPPSPALAQR